MIDRVGIMLMLANTKTLVKISFGEVNMFYNMLDAPWIPQSQGWDHIVSLLLNNTNFPVYKCNILTRMPSAKL